MVCRRFTLLELMVVIAIIAITTTLAVSPPLVWELPADFELDTEMLNAETGENGTVEVFRFFSDGSANASREFILRFRKLQRRFAVSPLTGLLLAKEEEAVL